MKKYLFLGGAGVAAGLTYAYAKRATRRRSQRMQNDNTSANNQNVAATDKHGEVSLDDAGTTNEMAVEIIRTLRDRAFDGSDEKLALALGRPAAEIRAWLDDSLPVDSDGLIKARGLADQRSVDVPHEPVGVGS
jgi:hypothetical protein